MRFNPILAVPIAFLLFKGGSVAYNASRLNFFVAKLVPRLQGLTPVLDIYIGVMNPTGGSFTIQSAAGTVYANNEYIGDLGSFTMTAIRPNTQTYFVATVRMGLASIVQNVYNAVSQGLSTISYALRFTGTINVNGLPVPVVLNYKII